MLHQGTPCFAILLALGIEKRSKIHPYRQLGSLLLSVCGIVVVLLVDYLNSGTGSDSFASHVQFNLRSGLGKERNGSCLSRYVLVYFNQTDR